MESIKNVVRWGNSAGILVPREWLGKQVKIELVDRTGEIKKEIFKILEDCLDDLIGIYLVGSYARNEQEDVSDIDVIAISQNTRKSIVSGRYKIEVYTLQSIKKTIMKNPIMIVPALYEAKPIMNKMLLEELKSIKIKREDFSDYIEECKNIVKINKGLIKISNPKENFVDSEIIYSLILRLRGAFMIKYILERKKYSNNLFKKWLIIEGKIEKEQVNKVYSIYRKNKEGLKIKEKILISIAEKLINLLENELNKYGKKKKET